MFKNLWNLEFEKLNCLFRYPQPHAEREEKNCGLHSEVSLVYKERFKVMLHETIRKDEFYRNTEVQCWTNVESVRNNVATMLQRCVALKIVVANRPV